MLFVITIQARYLPYALLFMSLVLGSPDQVLLQATGLLAAHLYDFLTRIWPTFGGGRNYITTPQFVKHWFAAAPGTQQARPYGTMMPGGGGAATGSSTRSAARTTASKWGPGRRLGE